MQDDAHAGSVDLFELVEQEDAACADDAWLESDGLDVRSGAAIRPTLGSRPMDETSIPPSARGGRDSPRAVTRPSRQPANGAQWQLRETPSSAPLSDGA